MFQKNKLSAAVATALAASMSAGVTHAQVLEEVIVTATKRAESMQDIPVAISAITGDTMRELGVASFDEYVKYLPNVVQQGRGPGQNEIYIRGVASEQSANTVSSVQGSAPGVALYLDEQPVSFGARNLDVYAADLARIEVLPGPQGTLFGASSQSGTVRYITNKPVQGEFQAGFRASYGDTTGGDISSAGEGYINLPLTDNIALRAAVYTASQGGWIDNVAGSFNPNTQELFNVMNRNQISGSASIAPGATAARANNSDLVEKNFNDANYRGARFGLAVDINDDWDLLLQHSQQSLDTQGVWEYNPAATGAQDQAEIYSPAQNDDDFGLTTLTVNGRVGLLDVIYTGGFLDRDIHQISDYTLYTFGGGYQVYYISNGYTGATEVFDFRKQYLDDTSSKRTTHEFRIQTPSENRVRATLGVFLDDVETKSSGQFQYFGSPDAGFDVASQSGFSSNPGTNNGPSGQNTIFRNDFTREEEQTAIFADVSFGITDALTLSVGARDYDIDFALTGSTGSSFACKGRDITGFPSGTQFFSDSNGDGTLDRLDARVATRPDGTLGCDGIRFDNNVTQRLRDLGATGTVENLGADGVANESDTIFRITADYQITDDVMVFATWSEGFRPLVTNRNAGAASGNQQGVFAGYVVPAVAKTDELTNFEIGMKGDFFDRLRLNATLYRSEIKDLQTTRFDPSNIAFLVFIENVGDAEVMGLDLDFTWAATENLTISGALGWVDSEITRLNDQLVGLAAPVGSELPYQADISFNLRGRYEFDLPSMDAGGFVQAAVTYTGESKAGIIGNAYFAEDTTRRIYGQGSGLEIANEGGTFGSARVGSELPGSQGVVANPNQDPADPDDDFIFSNGRYVQESYAIFGLSAGIQRDNWSAELYVDNVFDENAAVHISTFDYIPSVSTNRPRTFGMRFSYDFAD